MKKAEDYESLDITGSRIFSSKQKIFLLQQLRDCYLDDREKDKDEFTDLLLELILPELILYIIMQNSSLNREETVEKIKLYDGLYVCADTNEILQDYKLAKSVK